MWHTNYHWVWTSTLKTIIQLLRLYIKILLSLCLTIYSQNTLTTNQKTNQGIKEAGWAQLQAGWDSESNLGISVRSLLEDSQILFHYLICFKVCWSLLFFFMISKNKFSISNDVHNRLTCCFNIVHKIQNILRPLFRLLQSKEVS